MARHGVTDRPARGQAVWRSCDKRFERDVLFPNKIVTGLRPDLIATCRVQYSYETRTLTPVAHRRWRHQKVTLPFIADRKLSDCGMAGIKTARTVLDRRDSYFGTGE